MILNGTVKVGEGMVAGVGWCWVEKKAGGHVEFVVKK